VKEVPIEIQAAKFDMNRTKYNTTSEFKLLNTEALKRKVIRDLNFYVTEETDDSKG